jgi:6-phosphogluconolactonase
VAELVVSRAPVAEAAARLVAALEAIDGPARLGIAGGSVLDVLGQGSLAASWSRIRLTWVDERLVRVSDPASNRGAAFARTRAPLAARVLPLLLDGELEQPQLAVARVEAELATHWQGALDVTLLGLGEDGHVASLFPGHPFDTDGAHVMLVHDAPKPPPERITLTLSMLRTARTHVVYAVGAGKRDAIARVRAGDPTLPASHLEGVVIVTDEAGAG